MPSFRTRFVRELTLRRTLKLGVVFADSDDEEELSRTREYFDSFRTILSGAIPACSPDGEKDCLEERNIMGI